MLRRKRAQQHAQTPGTQFASFTSTKVLVQKYRYRCERNSTRRLQVLSLLALLVQKYLYKSTNTDTCRGAPRANTVHTPLRGTRQGEERLYSIYLLYCFNSTNTDAECVARTTSGVLRRLSAFSNFSSTQVTQCMRPSATSVCGLKLLAYKALNY